MTDRRDQRVFFSYEENQMTAEIKDGVIHLEGLMVSKIYQLINSSSCLKAMINLSNDYNGELIIQFKWLEYEPLPVTLFLPVTSVDDSIDIFEIELHLPNTEENPIYELSSPGLLTTGSMLACHIKTVQTGFEFIASREISDDLRESFSGDLTLGISRKSNRAILISYGQSETEWEWMNIYLSWDAGIMPNFNQQKLKMLTPSGENLGFLEVNEFVFFDRPFSIYDLLASIRMDINGRDS